MIFLGPGGTSGLGYESALQSYKKDGFSAMEVEFTYGVRMGVSEAKSIGALARKLGIRLSVHAPYYINLASLDKTKVEASRKRILDSCERGNFLGADYIVFHAGFYQGREPKDVYYLIRQQILEMQQIINKKGWRVILAPEVTGKPTQFGDIDELLALSNETGCSFTVDFSHWIAREQGRISYAEMFKKLKFARHIHGHFSGIDYSAKGERKHVLTPISEIRKLLNAAVRSKKSLTIINESPDPIGDSRKTVQVLSQIYE
ncbi:MAG: TIM barrel protein [Candidatus Woesearchaeota archaeon]